MPGVAILHIPAQNRTVQNITTEDERSLIYVTEPDAIDLTVVAEVLRDTGVKYAAGTTDFSASKAQNYEALLIRSATKIDSTIKDYFPRLKSIVRAGVGLDNVDLAYCKNEGISVYNAPGANADVVSEYVVAMMLHVLRGLNKLNVQRVREWERFAFRGSSINEHSIGIVGFGHIGRLVYEKLNAFSVAQFFVFDPYISPDSIAADNIQCIDLDGLLRKSSIISLHLPLTPETRYLIDERKLALMQRGTLLINSARGEIVDEAALIARATAGHLTYVADTVEGEPNVNEQLLGCEKIIITPHIASLTSSSEKEMVRQALANYLGRVPAKLIG